MQKCPNCGCDYQEEDFQAPILMMGLDICRTCQKKMTNEHGDLVIVMQGIRDATYQQHQD